MSGRVFWRLERPADWRRDLLMRDLHIGERRTDDRKRTVHGCICVWEVP